MVALRSARLVRLAGVRREAAADAVAPIRSNGEPGASSVRPPDIVRANTDRLVAWVFIAAGLSGCRRMVRG